MKTRIFIVGGLPDDPLPGDLIDRLSARSGSDFEWQWHRASVETNYGVDEKAIRRLIHELRVAKSKGQLDSIRVVKLKTLHNRVQNQIHSACVPINVPEAISTIELLQEWLFSDQANLIPHREWYGNVCEAALVAILSKLVKNKDWCKDIHGHNWTQEGDLLGQAPVVRSKFPLITSEAARMLGHLERKLLLCKGGTRGTKKEWCIFQPMLPIVLRLLLDQDFTQLKGNSNLVSLYNEISKDNDRKYRLDGEVVNERVREICRQNK